MAAEAGKGQFGPGNSHSETSPASRFTEHAEATGRPQPRSADHHSTASGGRAGHGGSGSGSASASGPHGRQPSYADRSPPRRDRSPLRRGPSPPRAERSPVRRDRSPPRRERSPVGRDRSPPRRDRSPPRRERSPVGRDRSPPRRDRSPPRRDRSPIRRDRDRSSPRRDRSPPRRDRSPVRRDRDRSPPRSDRSPIRRDRSPPRRDRSPIRRDRSPPRRDRSPPRRPVSPGGREGLAREQNLQREPGDQQRFGGDSQRGRGRGGRGGRGGGGGRGRDDRNREQPRGDEQWGRADDTAAAASAGAEGGGEEAKEKEGPNFGTSGLLTAEANTYKGVVIKYAEPPEARKPRERWRLYPFKDGKPLEPLYIHRQSAYLIGRDPEIAELPMAHPSISKQHAVLQYRLVNDRSSGRPVPVIKPYIIDLGSTNKTFLNGEAIEPQRYYELRPKDMLKFGLSSREYIVLHESATESDTEE